MVWTLYQNTHLWPANELKQQRDQLVGRGRKGYTLVNLQRDSWQGVVSAGDMSQRAWEKMSHLMSLQWHSTTTVCGHSTSKHEWKRPRKSGTSKWEVFLCVDLHTYCVCSRLMAKIPFQLIQLWSQLHGCLLHPQNADMATPQNDREILQNINYLHPHSGNHHQKAIWRVTASIRVC